MLAASPIVVSFYRGTWCPFCNLDLQALEDARPHIEATGASLIAISPQTGANSRRSIRQNQLGFPILSDPGNEVAADFGIRFSLPDYLVTLYRDTLNNDLAMVNGDASWTLPMPARFVIRQDGRIAYAEVNPDYTRRPDPAEVVTVLETLGEKAG
jgi:peroxiredoxin